MRGMAPVVRHSCSSADGCSGAEATPMLMAMRTFEGTCSECGRGELAREGAYERGGAPAMGAVVMRPSVAAQGWRTK